MAIQATFTADTKPLEAGLDRAAAKIAGVKKSSEDTGRSLKAIGSSFDGTRIEGAALRVAEGVRKAGGAATLTAAEFKKVDRSVTEALDKIQKMGGQAPKELAALRHELDRVRGAAMTAGDALGQMGGPAGTTRGIGALQGVVIGLSAAIATQGIGAIKSFAASIVESASSVADLSAKTGLSTSQVQKFGYAAKQTGASVDVVAGAVSQLSNRLVEGGTGTVSAVERLGLSFADLQRMDPGTAFETIAEAIRAVPDPMQQTQLAMELFGKSGAELLPAIKAGFVDLGAEAERLGLVIDDKAVQALDNFGDQWDRLSQRAGAAAAGVLGDTLRLIEAVNRAGAAAASALPSELKEGAIGRRLAANGPTSFGALGLYGSMAGFAADLLPFDGKLAEPGARPMAQNSPFAPYTSTQIAHAAAEVDAAVKKAGISAVKTDRAVKKISDSQRALNAETAKAFKVVANAGIGWDEYAGSVQLAEMELAQFLETQRLGNRGAIGEATNPLSAIMNGPYLYQLSGSGSPLKTAAADAKDWRAGIQSVAQAFGTLAQIAGPALDGISRSVGTIFGSANAGLELTGSLASLFPSLQTKDAQGNVVTSQRGRNVAGVIGAATTGASLGSMTSNPVVGGALGAGGGLATGLMAGATGAMLGASVGVGAAAAIYMAWRNRQAEKKALSEQRAQVIASAGGYDEFRKAVERAGFEFDHFLTKFESNNADTFTEGMNGLNVAIAEQQSRAKKLVDGLNEVARVQGVLSQQQFAQIRNLRPGDAGIEDVLAFAQGQRQQAESGVIRAVTALQAYGANALTDFGQAAQGAAGGLYALFSEAVAQGESAIDVLARLGPSIDTLSGLGVTGAGFNSLKVQQGIVTGAQTGPAAQLGAGLGQALAGFANSGLLSPELFGELANGIGEAYKAIELLGQGGLEAAKLFQPYLQSIDKMIRDNPALEEQLDDQTKSLLAFAREAGLIGPKFDSAADRILSALDRLIGKLDEFIGRMATAAGITIPTPGGPAAPNVDTGSGGGGNGGDYTVGTGYSTMGVATSAPMGGGMSQVITVQLGRETIARAVAEDLPRIVSVYGGVS